MKHKKWLKFLREREDFVDPVVDGKILGYYKLSYSNWVWRSHQNSPGSFSVSATDPIVDLVNFTCRERVGAIGPNRGSVPDRCSDICSTAHAQEFHPYDK